VNLKAALILLVFATAFTATAIAFTTPTSVSLPTLTSTVSGNISLIKPLGDPIGGEGFPN